MASSPMKMIKAVKKLKFWSRKKRKKKFKSIDHDEQPCYNFYNYQTPSTCHRCCSCTTASSSTQPSAPPLPSWLETEQTHESPGNGVERAPELVYTSSTQVQFSSQELVLETSNSMYNPILAGDCNDTPSYQQYMVPNPVYGLPVVETTRRREISVGFFGFVVKFGANLIRCFCPCFRIREIY